MVILRRKWLLVSMNDFMSTSSAAVYSRPPDAVAGAVCLVELIGASLVKICRVLVHGH
jgi:hypothetical protein